MPHEESQEKINPPSHLVYHDDIFARGKCLNIIHLADPDSINQLDAAIDAAMDKHAKTNKHKAGTPANTV